MKIGIDYFPASTHWPGVGRYAREFVRALAALEECPQLLLIDIGGGRRSIGEPHLGLTEAPPGRVRRVRLRAPRRIFQGLQRRTGWGVDRVFGGVDLFHRIHADWPPVSSAVQVQPFGELPAPGTRAEEAVGRDLARADHVLAMSRHGASEAVRRFGLRPERVHAVPIGSDQWSRQLLTAPLRCAPPRVLVLGATRTVRRHASILRAFEQLYAQGLAGELLCFGGAGDAAEAFAQAVSTSPARAAVRCEAGQEALAPRVVAESSVLVHLSEGEESAVTPLEAFSLGTPVVATGLGAFTEVLGDEALFVTNEEADADPLGLANKIARAIASASDPVAEERRRTLARRYTWRANALATIDVWRAILG